jgi:ankyrin repeat protein
MHEFIKAAHDGDLGRIQYYIKQNIDVNITDNNGDTALMLAAWKRDFNVVKELLANGAEIDKANKYGNTALMLAAGKDNLDIVKELIANGDEIDKANNMGYTALLFAAIEGKSNVVKLLIAHGAEIDKADNDGWTALIHTADNGHLDIAKELLNAGSDLLLNPKEGSIENIVLYKLLMNSTSDRIFNKLIDEGYICLNAVAKLELIRAFNFMLNHHDMFSKFYSKEEIEQKKLCLEACKPLEEFIDSCLKDINQTNDIHKLEKKTTYLIEVLNKYKDIAGSINVSEIAIDKYLINAKTVADAKYGEFTKDITSTIKAFMPKVKDQDEAPNEASKTNIGLMDLPNELLADIFRKAWVSNKELLDNPNHKAIEGTSLICATENFCDLDSLMHNLETLGELLHNLT